jgi:predicted hotdog family 3-hydroxylacyl-ACP dehydratase
MPEAAIPGLLIARPDEMLFFANVASVRDGIIAAAAETEPRPTVVLLDLSLTPEVDVPVVEALEDLHQRLTADGMELWLAYVRPDAKELLERAGVLAAIGDARIHARVVDAILAFVLRLPGADERVAVLTDLLAYIRDRATQPGTSAAGVETLGALEQRLAAELAAAGGARRGTPVSSGRDTSGRRA